MEYNKEKMAMVNGMNLPISFKVTIEVCNQIRGKTVESAKKILQDAIEMKRAIPMKRFKRDMGHKKTMAAGRYHVKACTYIQKIVDSAVANAQFKGLNTASLVLAEVIANRGVGMRRSGRHPGRNMKSSNLKIVLEEKILPKKERKEKKSEKKAEKVEAKK